MGSISQRLHRSTLLAAAKSQVFAPYLVIGLMPRLHQLASVPARARPDLEQEVFVPVPVEDEPGLSTSVRRMRAVGKHQVAFYFLEAKRTTLVDLIVSRLIGVLKQLARPKTARIKVRIFQIIIPFHQRAVVGVMSHQLDRLGDHVDGLRTTQCDAVLCLQSKDPFHCR